jgi:hypothetical protein
MTGATLPQEHGAPSAACGAGACCAPQAGPGCSSTSSSCSLFIAVTRLNTVACAVIPKVSQIRNVRGDRCASVVQCVSTCTRPAYWQGCWATMDVLRVLRWYVLLPLYKAGPCSMHARSSQCHMLNCTAQDKLPAGRQCPLALRLH